MAINTSADNVGTVRGIYESFAEGDVEAIVATWAPDITMIEPEGMVGGGSYHGPDEIVENVFGEIAEIWEDASVVPERVIDAGDTVVAIYTFEATSTATGKQVAYEGAHVFDFEDGQITRWRSYGDTALFNAALEG